MAINRVELVGVVGYVDIKYTENGTAITTISVGFKNGKKREDGKDDYDSIFIKFISGENSKTRVAEEVAECSKGDYIRVIGSLKVDKFTPKGSDKAVEKLSVIGWKFSKVEYDPTTRTWQDV